MLRDLVGSQLKAMILACCSFFVFCCCEEFSSPMVTEPKQTLLATLSCFLHGSAFLKHIFNLIRVYFTKESKLEKATFSLVIFISTNQKTKPNQQRVKLLCNFIHVSCGHHGKMKHAEQLQHEILTLLIQVLPSKPPRDLN